jgi:GTP cyclohydrolase II
MREPQNTNPIQQIAATELPTRWGVFRALGFERWLPGRRSPETALALVLGDPSLEAPLVRIHSQCISGEVLRSLRCDCGEQLELAMGAIAAEGRGLLIYEQQEGRGIGLMAKLQAYALQDGGLDTIAANHALGFEADCRDFMLPAAILKHLGVPAIRLLSNNPDKFRALARAGITVVEQMACEAAPSSYSTEYLGTKKHRMGHTLTLV